MFFDPFRQDFTLSILRKIQFWPARINLSEFWSGAAGFDLDHWLVIMIASGHVKF